MVDTEGLVLHAFVTEANYQDGKVASWLCQRYRSRFPTLKKVWADQSYRGDFVEEGQRLGIEVEIVERKPDQVGFVVQPRRWVVERTFAWLNTYRRLSKDYEYWTQTSDATIYAAMTHLMVRRLARLRPT